MSLFALNRTNNIKKKKKTTDTGKTERQTDRQTSSVVDLLLITTNSLGIDFCDTKRVDHVKVRECWLTLRNFSY